MVRTICKSVEVSLDEVLRYLPQDVFNKIEEHLNVPLSKVASTYNENNRCITFMSFEEIR